MDQMKGFLHNIGVKRVFKSNTVKKEFIVSRINGGAYPNVPFEALGDELIAKLDAIPPNTMVVIEYEIQGKTYTDKDGLPRSFVSLRALDIIAVESSEQKTKEQE